MRASEGTCRFIAAKRNPRHCRLHFPRHCAAASVWVLACRMREYTRKHAGRKWGVRLISGICASNHNHDTEAGPEALFLEARDEVPPSHSLLVPRFICSMPGLQVPSRIPIGCVLVLNRVPPVRRFLRFWTDR